MIVKKSSQKQRELRMNDTTLPLAEVPAGSGIPKKVWFLRFMDCNPFYLLSALLLVYGLYRISIEPRIFETELRQLLFSFCSLHAYQLLLVTAALFLASHKVWYDATLLISLENLLLLVPFILISQAVFLEKLQSWGFCIAALCLVLGRQWMIRCRFQELNISGLMFELGLAFLAVNLAMPLVFRHVLESKNETWTLFTPYCWNILLPVLALLANVLPACPEGSEAHRKSWLQLMIYFFWIIGTAAHLFSIGYVDDQTFRISNLSVVVWVLGWTTCNRQDEFRSVAPRLRSYFLAAPFGLAWLSLLDSAEKPVFFLMLLNALIYSVCFMKQTGRETTGTLAALSLAVAFAFVPVEYGRWLFPQFSRGLSTGAVIALALLVRSLVSKEARWGLFGAITAGTVSAVVFRHQQIAGHLVLQSGCVFYMLHSLRWGKNITEPGAKFSLGLGGVAWAADTLLLNETGARFSMLIPMLSALIVGVLSIIAWFRANPSILVGLSAGAVLVAPAAVSVSRTLLETPISVLALIASFVLLGGGTWFAVSKAPKAKKNA